MAEGIINLIPSHGQSSRGKWDSVSMIQNCLSYEKFLAGGRVAEPGSPPPKVEDMDCGC
jgi:hypothetical protein